MGTQKGKLFELARMYRTYQKKTKDEPKPTSKKKPGVEAKGQYYDEGKAINLSYNVEMYPEKLQDSHQRQSTSFSMWAEDHSEAFYVEPFDAEDTVEIQYRNAVAEDGQDDKLDKVVSMSSEEDQYEDMKQDEDKLNDIGKSIDDMLKSDDESNAMNFDNPDYESTKASEEESATWPTEEVTEMPKSKQQSYAYDASDEEFARDIGAILTGQKVYDSEQKKTIGKGSDSSRGNKPESPAPAKQAPKEEMLDPTKNEHKIFEKIAQSMTYANSYDLGAIALEEKFELMDREIEKDEVKTILNKQAMKYRKLMLLMIRVVLLKLKPWGSVMKNLINNTHLITRTVVD